MDKLKVEIQDLANRLLPQGGQVGGISCPKCNGGSKKEKSLSLSRTNTHVKYMCHRNSCGFKGTIVMIASLDKTAVPPAKKATAYTGKIESIPENILSDLQQDYYLTKGLIRNAEWEWAPDYPGGARLAMPIFSASGSRIGYSFRSLSGKQPKNIIQITRLTGPTMCWYNKASAPGKFIWSTSEPVIIVEDQISAIRASVFGISVALLGTNLSDEKIYEISRCKPTSVIIALDEDAQATSIAVLNKLAAVVKEAKAKLLKKDLKDSTDEEIREALKL